MVRGRQNEAVAWKIAQEISLITRNTGWSIVFDSDDLRS